MGNYTRGSYHRGRAAWTRNPRSLVGDYVGIELEVDHTLGSYRTTLAALPEPRGKRRALLRPITEMDMSLSSNGGVEIVFPPIPAKTILNDKTYFRRAITTMKEEMPEYTGPRNAGMHISINRNSMNPTVVDLLVLAFHHLPKEFIESIGGRELTNYCRQIPGGLNRYDWSRIDNTGQPKIIEKRLGDTRTIIESSVHNHGSLVNVSGSRIELRYPASTLNMDQITRNIAFVYYVRDYLWQQVYRGKLDRKETQTETFGTPEELKEKVIKYIQTRRKSKKRDLVLEVIDASNNRSSAPRPAI